MKRREFMKAAVGAVTISPLLTGIVKDKVPIKGVSRVAFTVQCCESRYFESPQPVSFEIASSRPGRVHFRLTETPKHRYLRVVVGKGEMVFLHSPMKDYGIFEAVYALTRDDLIDFKMVV